MVTPTTSRRGRPSRSIACTATSSACVESRPPETPMTTRRASSGSEREAPRERGRLDEEDLAAALRRAAPDRTGTNGSGSTRRRSVCQSAAGARVGARARPCDAPERARACCAAFCPKDVCRMRSVGERRAGRRRRRRRARRARSARSRRPARRGRRRARGRPRPGRPSTRRSPRRCTAAPRGSSPPTCAPGRGGTPTCRP